MANEFQIRLLNRNVGSILFGESASDLASGGLRRSSDGFILAMPMRLSLNWQSEKRWQPFVSNLHAFVHIDDGSGTEIGIARCSESYLPEHTNWQPRTVSLELRGSFEALNMLEKRRNGGPPKFWVRFYGAVAPLYYSSNAPDGQPVIHGVPERIFSDQNVIYPQDSWIRMTTGINLHGNVLIEMPVRPEFPSRWREVYEALAEAKQNFARGGSEGWKGCVLAVRLALEKWRDIEPEMMGDDWKVPTKEARERMSKDERICAIRWCLVQFAHFGAHTSATLWTRNDATFALATLAALLAERDP